jgi:hypothetical protein
VNQGADGVVILGQYAHHLLGLTRLSERGEVPEIGEQDHDFAAMAAQQGFVTDDEIGQLRGQEAA